MEVEGPLEKENLREGPFEGSAVPFGTVGSESVLDITLDSGVRRLSEADGSVMDNRLLKMDGLAKNRVQESGSLIAFFVTCVKSFTGYLSADCRNSGAPVAARSFSSTSTPIRHCALVQISQSSCVDLRHVNSNSRCSTFTLTGPA